MLQNIRDESNHSSQDISLPDNSPWSSINHQELRQTGKRQREKPKQSCGLLPDLDRKGRA